MSIYFLIIWCLFNHVSADYNLQGILASMKTKDWWKKQDGYNNKYKYDYIISLICHSISWTFMIMLPLAFYIKFNITFLFFFLFIANTFIHAWIDNKKANDKSINLVTDQLLHFLQIGFTILCILL